jgi:hypothetical protein
LSSDVGKERIDGNIKVSDPSDESCKGLVAGPSAVQTAAALVFWIAGSNPSGDIDFCFL